MGKSRIIFVLIVAYAAMVVGINCATNDYLYKKELRLRDEALTALNSFFDQRPMYVDLLYGPYSCSYHEVGIPPIKEPSFMDVIATQKNLKNFNGEDLTFEETVNLMKKNFAKSHEKEYGNIARIYDLDIFPTESEKDIKTGWALKIIKKKPDWANSVFVDGGGVETYLLFPKQIAYKKVAPLLQGGAPSIETIIQESLDFAIRNEKSDFQPFYSRGCTYNLENKMKSAINNEYFCFVQDTTIGCIKYGDGSPTIKDGGMHNGYYEVSFYRTQPTTYSIRYRGEDVVKKDKYMMIAICVGLLTLITGFIIYKIKKK